MLLTLSNLKALQADFVPRLVSNFETAFSVKLTEEAKTIRDVVDQIDARLFQSYTKPTVAALDANIRKGITAPDWVPATSPPEHVRPYVYNTMLTLVLVHNEITSTIPLPPGNPPTPTAHPLLTSVLTHLVTQISISLLNAFMERSRYTLPALMQATLDTEFIAQTMSAGRVGGHAWDSQALARAHQGTICMLPQAAGAYQRASMTFLPLSID